MGGEAEGDGAGVSGAEADAHAAGAAERARIERVKLAVLEGRRLPSRPKAIAAGWTVAGVLSPFLVYVAVLLGLGLIGRLFGSLNLPSLMGLLILVSVLAISFVSRAVERSRMKQIMRVLAPHKGLVCPTCHYPLTSSPNVGMCPECGTLYTRRQVVELWTSTYKLKHDWPVE